MTVIHLSSIYISDIIDSCTLYRPFVLSFYYRTSGNLHFIRILCKCISASEMYKYELETVLSGYIQSRYIGLGNIRASYTYDQDRD